MRKLLTFGFSLVLVCGLSGCDSSAETTIKEMIAAVEDLTKIFESITDKASAEAALPKLQKAAERVHELGQKVKNLKVTKGEQEKLQKYLSQMETAAKKLATAAINATMKAPDKAKDIMAALTKAQ
jgi:uncharacterized protein YoxC